MRCVGASFFVLDERRLRKVSTRGRLGAAPEIDDVRAGDDSSPGGHSQCARGHFDIRDGLHDAFNRKPLRFHRIHSIDYAAEAPGSRKTNKIHRLDAAFLHVIEAGGKDAAFR